MAFVVTLERTAQHLLGLALGAHLTQLLGISQHQLRLLALGGSQLLPGTLQCLASALRIIATRAARLRFWPQARCSSAASSLVGSTLFLRRSGNRRINADQSPRSRYSRCNRRST